MKTITVRRVIEYTGPEDVVNEQISLMRGLLRLDRPIYTTPSITIRLVSQVRISTRVETVETVEFPVKP